MMSMCLNSPRLHDCLKRRDRESVDDCKSEHAVIPAFDAHTILNFTIERDLGTLMASFRW